jgi:hypothetical protein
MSTIVSNTLQLANGYGREGHLNWPSDHWCMIRQTPKGFIGFKIVSSVGVDKVTCVINDITTQKLFSGEREVEILVSNPEEFTPGDINNTLTISPETYWLTAPMQVWFICSE